MKTEKNIGPEFRKVFDNYSLDPEDHVWESIASKLKKKKTKRRYIILLSGLLLMPAILCSILDKKDSDTKELNENEVIPKTVIQKPVNEEKENTKPLDLEKENPVSYADHNNDNILRSPDEQKTDSYNNLTPTDTISSPEKVATKKSKTVEPNPKAKQKEDIKSDPKKEEVKKKAPVKPKKSKPKKKRAKSKEKPKGIWSVSPYIFIDTHHPFQIKTNTIATVNYGMYVNYASGRFLLRLGYRTSNLKYLSQESNSFLRQELSYKEYPLELKYHFNQDNRIIPSIIGGVSFLSLSDASEFEEQNGMIVENRNTTNFNRSNFTFNLGGGLQTRITDDLMINFESIFKYHFETFKSSRNSATFSITSQIGIQYSF